jgi:hypothetical protein
MHMTAVPEDHLMRSKLRIAGHMDYLDEIHKDHERVPNYWWGVLGMPRLLDTGRIVSKKDRCRFAVGEVII